MTRLAGCIVIELLLAGGLWAARASGAQDKAGGSGAQDKARASGAQDKASGAREARPEYQAGAATTGRAKALVLEDRRGGRAIFAETDFEVTRAVSDLVAAQLLKSYDLDRAALLIRAGSMQAGSMRAGSIRDAEPAGAVDARTGQAENLVTAISAALGALEPAEVRYDSTGLSVRMTGGRCLASLAADASLVLDRCGNGTLVRGPVRAAFQMVEPEHGLLHRPGPQPAHPVQAIALGKQVVVVALGGDSVLPAEFAVKRLLFAPRSNDSVAPPDDARIREAIRRMLGRVRR